MVCDGDEYDVELPLLYLFCDTLIRLHVHSFVNSFFSYDHHHSYPYCTPGHSQARLAGIQFIPKSH